MEKLFNKCKMQNDECKMMVCPAGIIQIVSEADTSILYFAF